MSGLAASVQTIADAKVLSTDEMIGKAGNRCQQTPISWH